MEAALLFINGSLLQEACVCCAPQQVLGPQHQLGIPDCLTYTWCHLLLPSGPQKLLGPTWRPAQPPPGARIVSLEEFKRSHGWA